jgi:Domain of unknown function (DUF4381)
MRDSWRLGACILMLAGCSSAWAAQPTPPTAAASAAPAEDIRDIRGPKSLLDLSDSPGWLIAFGAAFFAAAGYGLWHWRRRSARDPVLEPFELALQQLDEARRKLQPGAGREFAGAVSDVVRRYIELQFRVAVSRRTTEEFLQDLLSASNTTLAQQRPLLSEFLGQSDLIKFAGDSLSLQTLESLLQSARHLVRETARATNADAAIPAT